MTRDLYLADSECQGVKGLEQNDAPFHRITIGQEVIKFPFFGASASLMVVLIRSRLRAWGLWIDRRNWLDRSTISGER